MELNREQIIKALECCTNKAKDGMYEIKCIECPFEIGNEDCKDIDAQALSLIKELTKDVERVAKQCAEIIVECDERDAERLKQVADWKAIAEGYQKQFEDCAEDRAKLTEENERLRADTVRKMQERLKAEAYPFPCAIGVEYAVPYCKIDQIAKEMVEGAG